jgi:thiamine biosynthesis lipoprotein
MNHPMPPSREREILGEIMKTDIFVKIFAPATNPPEPQLENDLNTCFDMFRAFEARYSRFLPASELSRFNQSTEWHADEEFFDILARAKEYWAATDGLFNPTILTSLEHSGYTSEKLTTAPLNNLKETIFPLSELVLDPETRITRKPLELRIDLGGIGKGYCVDIVTHWLESCGYENFLVYAGGDMYASGANFDTDTSSAIPWFINIEHPLDNSQSLTMVALRDQSIATSGRNRRHWMHEDQKRHHLIHPITGQSEHSRLVTVTVISTNTVDADVWAKTLFLLGEKDGILKANQQHIPAYFTFEDGSSAATSYFQNYVIPKTESPL